MSKFIQDLRYALRQLRQGPRFTAVVLVSLALGIGANAAIFSLLNSVLLKSLPVREPERLVLLSVDARRFTFTYPLWEAVRDRQQSLDGVLAWGTRPLNLGTALAPNRAPGMFVSGSAFPVLGVAPAAGRLFTPEDDKPGCDPVAVLGYGYWKDQYGGSPDIIGRAIQLEEKPFTVIGVTRPGFFGMEVGYRFSVAIPFCAEPVLYGKVQSNLDKRGTWWIRVLGRLKPGESREQALAGLQAIRPAVRDATLPTNWRPEDLKEYLREPFALSGGAAGGVSFVRRQYETSLYVLMGLVGLVLLVACANIATLLLARGSARAREFAVRLALGASRGGLIRQFLTESLVLAATGAALGIIVARWSTRLLILYLSTERRAIELDLAPDLRVIGFTTVLAALTAILAGLAPALRATRVAPNQALKEKAPTAGAERRFGMGRILVVTQIALSLLLAFGAGLLIRSFTQLATQDPGFTASNILLADFNLSGDKEFGPFEARRQMRDRILETFTAIPGVKSAALVAMTPISGSNWTSNIQVEGFTPKTPRESNVYFNQVSPDYFATMGTPLLAGRAFNSADTANAPRVAIINETLARRFFGNGSPLGRTLSELGPAQPTVMQVVGIVRDSRYRSLMEPVPPTVFVADSQEKDPSRSGTVVIKTSGDLAGVQSAAIRAAAGLRTSMTLSFRPFERVLDDSLARERALAMLSGFFGALALLLAAIGLYGLTSYGVGQRRNEIGIRMALGAQPGTVLRMILREVGGMAAAGILLGVAASYALSKWLASLIFETSHHDPATFAVATLLLGAVALVAGFFPARRAARLHPMEALRDE